MVTRKRQLQILAHARNVKRQKGIGKRRRRGGRRGKGLLGDAFKYVKDSTHNLVKNNRLGSNALRSLAGAARNYGGITGNVGAAALSKAADWVHSKGYGMRRPRRIGVRGRGARQRLNIGLLPTK